MPLRSIIRKILHYLNLEPEIDDYETIHDSISKDVVFKGTNLWILIFAIFVASVGLNMNSTAVVIGAMLISPLMGPINGMGYSIAIYDFTLFRKALRNFTFAVLVSLFASTTYFLVSPISTAHSELLARTSPTIYDVVIAWFGGLAGIVAISSRQKGNVIPGVAIATALMPPLCTAGYGLATVQFNYFFGAMYLFTINTVFIALSSVSISQLLKFPIRTNISSAQKKRINQGITFTIILIIIPSIYFGYNLVQKERFIANATKYIHNISVVNDNFLLKHEINPASKTITLVYGGVIMTEEQKSSIVEKAKDFSLNGVTVQFNKGLSFGLSDSKNVELETLKQEMSRLTQRLKEKEEELGKMQYKQEIGLQILNEIQNLYPQISACVYADSFEYSATKKEKSATGIVIFRTKGDTLSTNDKEKVYRWLQTRLNQKKLKVFYEN
jgi:uncharacterized hydrophobic protein (TIGR00271 family)